MTHRNNPDDSKTKLQVVIAGEVVVLTGEESPEYIQRVARYIDKKMHELGRTKKVVSFNSFSKTLLIAINIADDLFKEIDANEKIRLEYAKLQTDHTLMSDEFDLLKSSARVANQKLEEQLNANARLYKELGALKAHAAEFESQKITQSADYNALMQERQAALVEIEGLQKANESLFRNNQSLSSKLEELQKINQSLKEDLARAGSEVESARRELDDYIDTFAEKGAPKKVYKFKK
ncbi:MAG: cell division protein ZapA [Defluviitaleaceae bacterium]|nr:cell division protein ZapA [Defluviitaleaceae bacterium]